MQILTNNKIVFIAGETIEKGTWENDPSRETYRIKNGGNYQYAVIADFGLYDVEVLPEDFEPNKYCYTETDGFYLNPDYEDPVSPEEQSVIDSIMQEVSEYGY